MKNLIRAFINKYLCCHEWEKYETVVTETTKKEIIKHDFLFKCTKCGKLHREIFNN